MFGTVEMLGQNNALCECALAHMWKDVQGRTCSGYLAAQLSNPDTPGIDLPYLEAHEQVSPKKHIITCNPLLMSKGMANKCMHVCMYACMHVRMYCKYILSYAAYIYFIHTYDTYTICISEQILTDIYINTDI